MAISRQTNFLGQMRVDTPHLKAIESAVANDFDLLVGKMMSGQIPLVIKGFTIGTANTVGTAVENLQLSVAGGLLMHFGASEAGTIFGVSDTAPAELLNGLNSKVMGSFTAGVTNYVGLDLYRAADTATSDLVQFYDANTDQEVPQTVPLARTLQYKIVISTQTFAVASNIVPIAKIVTSASNTVVSITDARRLMFRLGSGGDNPSAAYAYPWGTRLESAITFVGTGDPFTAEDKSLTSLKGWMDMITTVAWEAKGGQYWYSPVHRDNVKLANGQPVLSTGDNFFFPLVTITAGNATRAGATVTVTSVGHQFINGQIIDVGGATPDPDFPQGTKTITGVAANTFTYTEAGAAVSNAQTLKISSLMWSGLSLIFENSPAWNNPIAASASVGVAIPDGGCLYVDLTRENNSGIVPAVASLLTLGYSTIPGRRMILAWRNGDYMYAKDRPFEIGRFINPVATNLALGIVQLNQVAGTPGAPRVVSIMANGRVEVVASGGNATAATFTGNGSGQGVLGTGGATGVGVWGQGNAAAAGVYGAGDGASTGPGGQFQGGRSGNGVTSVAGIDGGYGGHFTAQMDAFHGVYGIGGSEGYGVYGIASGGGGATGVFGQGAATGDGHAGVTGVGGTGDGRGGSFVGGGTNGIGVFGSGTGTGNGATLQSGTGATGDGAVGTALSTNGNGFFGTGAGTGHGIKGQGGGNGGYGGYFTGGAVNGHGVYANGGANNGTGLVVDGGATNGYGIIAQAFGSGFGILSTGGASGIGIRGIGAAGTDGVQGVSGTTATVLTVNGILGTGTGSATGVKGISTNGYGVVAESDTTAPVTCAFRIVPQDAAPTGPALVGDMYVTTAGRLMICTTAGTPGTFTIVGTQT